MYAMKTISIVAMIGLVCLLGCTSQPGTSAKTEVESADPIESSNAVEFNTDTKTDVPEIAQLIDGEQWKSILATHAGSVVVVDLWASW